MKRWPKKLMGEVVTCLDNQRIPVKEEDRQKRIGSVPYYGANGQVGWIDEPIFNEPLLLIAEDGGHFDEPEKGVAYTIRGPSWVNNHAHALRPDESKVLIDFLGYHFRHFNFLPYITGTTRAKLNQRDLMRVEVPVPPLMEQEQIVKLLDEADVLRKLRAHADRRTADLIPALFHEMFGINRGWPIEHLEHLCDRITVGHVGPMATEYQETGISFLRGQNIKRGYIDLSSALFVSKDFHRRLSKSAITPGDVVSVRTGKPGTTAVVPPSLKIANCADLIVMTCGPRLDPEFLCELLNQRLGDKDKIAGATGIAQQHFNIGEARRLELVIPPLTLQNEFAARVAEIRALETDQSTSRQRLDDLFNSLLHRAFQGEL